MEETKNYLTYAIEEIDGRFFSLDRDEDSLFVTFPSIEDLSKYNLQDAKVGDTIKVLLSDNPGKSEVIDAILIPKNNS